MKINNKNLSNKRYVGCVAENVACDFLLEKGLFILEKNYFKRCGEIDIIAKEKDTIVFIEVKCRKSNAFGSPFAAITKRKQKSIREVATYYLLEKYGKIDIDVRFDALGIVVNGGDMDICWIKNAF